MYKGKIFGIGLPKTATTSLSVALYQLGYSTIHNGPRLIKELNNNEELNEAPLNSLINQFDAFLDYPMARVWQSLDEHYPNSKFILTQREPKGRYNSILNHHKRYPAQWTMDSIYDYDICTRESKLHNDIVLNYFKNRKDDLLVINIFELSNVDKWNKLCQFLDIKDLPDKYFPRFNDKNSYGEVLFENGNFLTNNEPSEIFNDCWKPSDPFKS